MDVLSHLFKDSKDFGDDQRLPPHDRDKNKFQDIPMASGVAAQFIVTKKAIQMRPLAWWEKLMIINNSTGVLTECDNSNYKLGTEVASTMERLWHNFFKDGRNMKTTPLYLPDISSDTDVPMYFDIPSPQQHDARETQYKNLLNMFSNNYDIVRSRNIRLEDLKPFSSDNKLQSSVGSGTVVINRNKKQNNRRSPLTRTRPSQGH